MVSFSFPKAATYYGGYSYKVDHNMAPKPWISIPNIAQIGGFLYFGGHFGFQMAAIANQRWISISNIKIYLETKFHPNRRIFVFWRPFWIQIDRHSKPTMNINSQHHNLLGKTNFAPIGGFCIWRPFYTLFTMATSAILKLFNP